MGARVRGVIYRVGRKLRGVRADVLRTFYPHLWLRQRSLPSRFLKDTSTPAFTTLLQDLRRHQYKAAVILGNGPSFARVDAEAMRQFRDAHYLTIGLNRTIYRHITRVLIWSDVETLYSILGDDSVISQDDPDDPMHVIQAVLPIGAAFRDQIARWESTQSLRAFHPPKLFMFRTVLTAALHLCFQLGIDKVLLAGVDFDTREYFFSTDRYNPTQAYELRSDVELQTHFRGYSTHRIVKEFIESLIQQEGFEIQYLGDSAFLRTVDGIRKSEQLTPYS